MGYYTSIYVTVEAGNASEEDLDRISEKLHDCASLDGDMESWSGCVKWYEYTDDMLEISKEFPHLRFCVHGDGESSDDLWEDHWENGCRQHCDAVIPPYDPNEMKPFDPDA